MAEHPKFDEFKRRALMNPDVRAAYIASKVRHAREERGETDPTDRQENDRG